MDLNLIDNIPTFMRAQPGWVGFSLIEKPGKPKPAKVPIDPHTGLFGSVADSAKCGSFEEALAAQARYYLDGIGIVLGNGLYGVDFDHCVTDGIVSPRVHALVDRIGSYTEVSWSGTGVHIYLLGDKPIWMSRCKIPDFDGQGGDLEIYDRGRFFVVTGRNELFQENRTLKTFGWYGHDFDALA